MSFYVGKVLKIKSNNTSSGVFFFFFTGGRGAGGGSFIKILQPADTRRGSAESSKFTKVIQLSCTALFKMLVCIFHSLERKVDLSLLNFHIMFQP